MYDYCDDLSAKNEEQKSEKWKSRRKIAFSSA